MNMCQERTKRLKWLAVEQRGFQFRKEMEKFEMAVAVVRNIRGEQSIGARLCYWAANNAMFSLSTAMCLLPASDNLM